MNEQECQELLMSEVTGIDLVSRSGWTLPVPFGVPNVSEMTVTDYLPAAVLLSIDYAGDGDAMMKPTPQHKASPSREACGVVYSHTLQVPIDKGFRTIRTKVQTLQQTEFNIVLHTYNGTRYLIHTLPNTPTFDIDEQAGQYMQQTVKVVAKSMSSFIRLNITETT